MDSSSVAHTTLRNGVQVATDRMEWLSSAIVNIGIKAGGRYERAEQCGISHFVEHMVFKGTETRSAFDINHAIESVGGSLNAVTSSETTVYTGHVLAEHLPLALELIVDFLRRPLLAESDVETERNVILQEIRTMRDSPQGKFEDLMSELIYPEQPLGRNVGGEEATVHAIQAADLRAYMQRMYQPSQIVVVVAGAVEHDEIVTLVDQLMGDLVQHSESPVMDAAVFVGGEEQVEAETEQVLIELAWEAPAVTAPDRFATAAFSALLGGPTMTSRLMQRAREELGLCYGIGASWTGSIDTGLMAISTATAGELVPVLAKVIIEEMVRLTEAPTTAELDLARAQARAGMLMSAETPEGRCARLGTGLMVYGRPIPIAETLAKIEAVDLAQIQAAGEKLIGAKKMALGLYGKGASSLRLADVRQDLERH